MSCKRPIFLAIDGVSRDLVEKAKCGIFVEPENSVLIAKKARELSLMSKDTLIKMGENGYNYAKNNFDRTKLSIKYASRINSIIK